jgi:hypothetical protein
MYGLHKSKPQKIDTIHQKIVSKVEITIHFEPQIITSLI